MSSLIQDLKDQLAEANPDALLADGFDQALIGVVDRFNETYALYDLDRCLEILRRQGMSLEEAEEYMSFNVVGAWAGGGTPCFARLATLRPGRRKARKPKRTASSRPSASQGPRRCFK